MNFLNVLRAEFAKIFTVRLWWILLIVLFGYVAFVAAAVAGAFAFATNSATGHGDQPQIPSEALAPLIYSLASSVGYVFPVLFGALATSAEFRHQTLTPTFLATQRRGLVLSAKFVCLAVIGFVYGLVAAIASTGVGSLILALSGHGTGMDNSDNWALIARVVLAMAIWSVIGVGLGTLIPNQAAVIVIVLAFTQFVEPILRMGGAIWKWTAEVGRFLPGAVSDALVGSSIFNVISSQGPNGVEPLNWWSAGLVLLGYAIVAGVIGWLTSWKRDVT